MTEYTIDTEHMINYASVWRDGEFIGEFHGPDAVANARLFAAATGLLDALKKIAHYHQATAPIAEMARAAIAAAE